MPDIIQLLPDVVANQIAAGEVIQRPASALKELMENAVDAGGKIIRVVVREAGKSLIQVIDNGCGMSETDARMSFERYATSKIRKADDLFAILTMGFRGEALASIAAIAHVELRTKRQEDETGIQLNMEGGELVNSVPVAVNSGTSIAVKNLFFNVPARRNFLKSNAAEMRHIIEEFQRVALAHPSIEMILHHNDTEIINLKPGNLRQRITSLLGSSYNEKLVPVEEDTTLVTIHGFVGKPAYAKKIRGEQYFFVNSRYIRDPYLHHAVSNAFEDLIPLGSYPSYFLFLEIDPSKIDVNIHPTKTEIKFEDDKSLYAILRAAVKRALGKYSVTPTLDFEQETAFNIPLSKLSEIPVPPKIQFNPSFNPFKPDSEIRFPSRLQQTGNSGFNRGQNWSAIYEGLSEVIENKPATGQSSLEINQPDKGDDSINISCFQLGFRFIAMAGSEGLIVIEQQAAHERILYEKNLSALTSQPVSSQKLVFPKTLEWSPQEFLILSDIKNELHAIGFDMNEFGSNTFVIHGIPPLIREEETREILENLLSQVQLQADSLKLGKAEAFALAAARRMAVRPGKELQPEELKQIIIDLFSCPQPQISPSGKPVFISLSLNEIDKKFS